MAYSPTGPQVFISFQGGDVRRDFVSSLHNDLRRANINAFIDTDEQVGRTLSNLLMRIEDSAIALVIFSNDFTSSEWCLDELAMIHERTYQSRLKVVPIFYKIEPSVVKQLKADFGQKFSVKEREFSYHPERTRNWKKALMSIPDLIGITVPEQSDRTDVEHRTSIVLKIQHLLADMVGGGNQAIVPNRQDGSTSMIPFRQPEREVNRQEGSIVTMVSARELQITHSENSQKWVWSTIYEAPNNNAAIEIVKMTNIHWLKIFGTFTTENLTAGRKYEAVFLVKLEDNAAGWGTPVTLKLKVEQQDGSKNRKDRNSTLKDYIGHDWVDILAGVFVAPPRNAPAEITFTMYQHEDKVKKNGLVIKGVAIRPTN